MCRPSELEINDREMRITVRYSTLTDITAIMIVGYSLRYMNKFAINSLHMLSVRPLLSDVKYDKGSRFCEGHLPQFTRCPAGRC